MTVEVVDVRWTSRSGPDGERYRELAFLIFGGGLEDQQQEDSE